MKKIKFTEKYLEKFFEDNFIEDEELFNCLKDREGIIKETSNQFDNEGDEHMVLEIKLLMRNL